MTKIDYEITVDVSGADVETKKQVQDAFYKLGFKWGWYSDIYSNLGCSGYTNKDNGGNITGSLMYVVNRDIDPTHTINELLELVGMENKTKLFNLAKALTGEPVITRGGHKAYIRHHETLLKSRYPLIGYILRSHDDNEMITWTVDGFFNPDAVEGSLDIVGMWKEPLEFGHWDVLHPSINYIAKDLGGEWWGYAGKPNLNKLDKGWVNGSIFDVGLDLDLEAINRHLFPNCYWKDSLIKRPEK